MNLSRALYLFMAFYALTSTIFGAEPHETVSGAAFIAISPISTEPVYWRGEMPYRGWDMGLDLSVVRKRYELFFGGMVAGGTPFDNPERMQFNFGGGIRITKKLMLLCDVFNLYSLNALSRVDPRSRTPTSGINQTWVKVRYEFGREPQTLRIYYGHGIRGNLSLYFPVDYTGPYVSQYAALEYVRTIPRNFKVTAVTETYFTDEFNKAHIVFNFGVGRRIFNQLIVKAEVNLHANMGIPDGKLDAFGRQLQNSQLVRFSLNVPFGTTH